MTKNDLETPALCVDINGLRHNMEIMNQSLAGLKAKLRPHFKTCKTLEIVKMQMEYGAKGITCSKLGEAEILATAGISNILIANEIVQPTKLKRMAHLALGTHLIVCVDREENILAISKAAKEAGATVYIYIELDVGMKRCGVTSKEQFLTLVQLIDSCEGIVFEGIQAYAGQLSHEENVLYKKEEVTKVVEFVKEVKEYVESNGFQVKEISGASSNTSMYKAQSGVYTEIQAGSYVFMDTALKNCSLPFETTLRIMATIISHDSQHIVIDCGAKCLGLDQCYPDFPEYKECTYSLSEEHFGIYGSNMSASLNDKVTLIPGHCCTTVNLFDFMYVCDGNEVIAKWTIEGRGKSV